MGNSCFPFANRFVRNQEFLGQVFLLISFFFSEFRYKSSEFLPVKLIHLFLPLFQRIRCIYFTRQSSNWQPNQNRVERSEQKQISNKWRNPEIIPKRQRRTTIVPSEAVAVLLCLLRFYEYCPKRENVHCTFLTWDTSLQV